MAFLFDPQAEAAKLKSETATCPFLPVCPVQAPNPEPRTGQKGKKGGLPDLETQIRAAMADYLATDDHFNPDAWQ